MESRWPDDLHFPTFEIFLSPTFTVLHPRRSQRTQPIRWRVQDRTRKTISGHTRFGARTDNPRSSVTGYRCTWWVREVEGGKREGERGREGSGNEKEGKMGERERERQGREGHAGFGARADNSRSSVASYRCTRLVREERGREEGRKAGREKDTLDSALEPITPGPLSPAIDALGEWGGRGSGRRGGREEGGKEKEGKLGERERGGER